MLRKRRPLSGGEDDKRRAKQLDVKEVIVDGEEQTIVAPPSYEIPEQFEWTAQKIRVADLIADGVPVSKIIKLPGMPTSRTTIYQWIRHPEYKKYIDTLVMQTGLANQAERVAAMTKVLRTLYDKFEGELAGVPLTPNNASSLLERFFGGLKQLQEDIRGYDQLIKVESSAKVQQETLNYDIDKIFESCPEEQRAELQAEFARRADEFIRSTTGGPTPTA